MTKYDKELQSGTPEYEKAVRPIETPDARDDAAERPPDDRPDDKENQIDDGDGRS